MNTLSLCGGEKGGVGKSFFSRTVLQYHIDRKIPFIAFDTDRSNPDVKRCYTNSCGVELGIFSEATRHEDSANAIFNASLESDVICNLPAQVSPALKAWIQNNQLLDLADEVGINIRLFYVSDAGYESLTLFQHSLRSFGERIPHILVKNHGMTDDWEPLDNDAALQQTLTDYGVTVISLPRFIGNRDRNFIDSQSLSFGEALNHPQLGAISRQRVKTYLKKAYAEFDRTQLFQAPPPTPQKRRKRVSKTS